MADARLKELGVSFHFFDLGDIGAVITDALKNLGATAIEGGWLSRPRAALLPAAGAPHAPDRRSRSR